MKSANMQRLWPLFALAAIAATLFPLTSAVPGCTNNIFEASTNDLVVTPNQTVYLPGATVTFNCPDGHELSGSAFGICLLNSTWFWSGEQAKCNDNESQIHCTFPDVENLKEPADKNFKAGDAVTFRCEPGYIIRGSTAGLCQENGTWSSVPSECKQEDPCDSTPCANDGSCSFSGQRCTCSCSPFCKGSNCSKDPGCSLRSKDRKNTLLVKPVKNVYFPGDTVNFDCIKGYKLSSSAVRFCRSNLSWSEDVRCIHADLHWPQTAVIVCASLGGIVILLIVGVVVYFVCCRIRIVDSSGRTVDESINPWRSTVRNVPTISNEIAPRLPCKDRSRHQGDISVAPSDNDNGGFLLDTGSRRPLPDSPNMELELTYIEVA